MKSFGTSFGPIVSGLTARRQQLLRRNHGKIETETTSIREIISSSIFCFLMSMVTLVLPILLFFLFSLGTVMLCRVVIGVLLIFAMGYLSGRLRGE